MNQRLTESKSVALPLGYTPMLLNYYTKLFQENQEGKIYFLILTKNTDDNHRYFIVINKKLPLLFQVEQTEKNLSQIIQVLFHDIVYVAEL